MSSGGNLGNTVFWLTGLSGVGKTTIANEIVAQLRAGGEPTVHIDGDIFRRIVGEDAAGYSLADRRANAFRICRMAKEISDQGLIAVVSTISLFHDVHDWNRANLDSYFEVWLQSDEALVRVRDPKGIYRRAGAHESAQVVGIQIPPEFPGSPDLALRNDGDVTPFELAGQVIAAARQISNAVKSEGRG